MHASMLHGSHIARMRHAPATLQPLPPTASWHLGNLRLQQLPHKHWPDADVCAAYPQQASYPTCVTRGIVWSLRRAAAGLLP